MSEETTRFQIGDIVSDLEGWVIWTARMTEGRATKRLEDENLELPGLGSGVVYKIKNAWGCGEVAYAIWHTEEGYAEYVTRNDTAY